MTLKTYFAIASLLGCCAIYPVYAQNTSVDNPMQKSRQNHNQLQNTQNKLLDEKIAYNALEKAKQSLNVGHPQQAIAALQTAIQYFEKYQNSSQDTLYAANGTAETLLYLTLDMGKQKNIRVFSGCWADLYFQAAYAFIEMNDLKNAQVKLKSALTLSPFNSEYLKEAGFIQQAQKQWQASLESFKTAEQYLYLLEPEEKRLAIQQSVRRSLGVSLIELNQLDEAIQYFNKVLKVDPSDAKARNELNYIEELKKKGHVAKQPIGRV
jgi:tetratricopeptide (TPR) repeat protein